MIPDEGTKLTTEEGRGYALCSSIAKPFLARWPIPFILGYADGVIRPSYIFVSSRSEKPSTRCKADLPGPPLYQRGWAPISFTSI
jgi:hypothetical protein